MSVNIHEIKKAIGYESQLKDNGKEMLFYLGATMLCGMVAAANFEPEKVNTILNTVLKTTTPYLSAEFGNATVGTYSAALGGYTFGKTLQKKEARKTMKTMVRQIENYERIKYAESIDKK